MAHAREVLMLVHEGDREVSADGNIASCGAREKGKTDRGSLYLGTCSTVMRDAFEQGLLCSRGKKTKT